MAEFALVSVRRTRIEELVAQGNATARVVSKAVNDPDRCVPFWESLLHFLGLKTLIKGEGIVYCIGARTGVMVRGAPPEKREAVQSAGLLNGPVTHAGGRTDVVTSQSQVDELLESLGF